MSHSHKERFYLVLIFAAGAFRFLNLGFLDMQAWDEALYAVRAESILRYGVWLDQTPYALDGLYSTLHPPLYVWLTALSFGIFGVTEFAARLFSALLGLLTLPLIYALGKRIADREVGLFATLLFALNPFVSFFARQGQFDTALVFFLTLSIYYLIRADRNERGRYSFYAGIAVGAALMTKLFVGLGIPLVYALWITLSRRPEKSPLWKSLLILLSGAALIALPWHIFMTVRYGNGDPFFILTTSALFERSVSGIEGNVKPLEVFYFLNQLFVLFPLGAVSFFYGIVRHTRQRDSKWTLPLVWFCVYFIVFSLTRTKLAVYVLPMLVPASLIAAQEIARAVGGDYKKKDIALLIGATLLSLLWASSQDWRNGIKDVLISLLNLNGPMSSQLLHLLPFFGLCAGCLLVTLYLWRKGLDQTFLSKLPIFFFIPASLISLYNVLLVEKSHYIDGGADLAHFIEQHGYNRIVVAGYERNPQLTYYLGGVDIGWRDDIVFRRMIPPKEREKFRSWMINELLGEPDDALIVVEKDKFIRYEVIDPLKLMSPDFVHLFESRRYSVFQRGSLLNFARSKKSGSFDSLVLTL